MANVKVAINGFGRIGRLAFRQMFDAAGYEIVAINDLTSPKMLAHLLKYDSAQGRYKYSDTVVAGEDSITVNGKTIKIYAEKDAANLPWKKHDVDVVLECTGFYCSKDKASAHITAGAKKVVISAPAGNDLPTVVFSVNENILKASDTVISAASCTTNCLAPMADTLNKLCKIKKGYMTTIHAYTGDQMVLDGPHRKGDLRRARAAAVNIVVRSGSCGFHCVVYSFCVNFAFAYSNQLGKRTCGNGNTLCATVQYAAEFGNNKTDCLSSAR